MHDTRRTRVVLGVLLTVALALITIDYRGGSASPLNGLRGVGSSVFGPIERGTSAVTRPVSDAVGAITGAPAANRRIRALERQNQKLRERARAGQLDKQQAHQLGRLLHLAGLGRYRILAAQVIALGGGRGYEDTVTIDAGSRDRVKPNMTVVTGGGLVGRVTEVGPSTATVRLVTDAASSVGARLEGSQQLGVVRGNGHGLSGHPSLTFDVLDSNARLHRGQRIVTFGSQHDRPYVPGVPIGTIESVKKTPGKLTRTAQVKPFVSFTTLDIVGVVMAPPKTNPRDSVLPPKPTVSASPSPSSSGKSKQKQKQSPSPSPSPTTSSGN